MSNRAENFGWVAALQQAMDGMQADLWTALPAEVVSFNAAQRTVVAQPTIRCRVENPDSSTRWETMPQFYDVVVQFPGGGGFVLTFPLKAGDEGIIIFASRCIDAWWQSSGIQNQAEMRMHDLSDGFFIPTVRSVPNVEPSISTSHAELRSEDGGTFVRLTSGGNVEIMTPATASVTADTVNVVGAESVNINAGQINITGELVINGQPYLDHKHPQSGGGITGGVL